jgi:hypothetical protein
MKAIFAFQYGGNVLSHSEEPVANFNIENINKSAEEFCQTKKFVLTSMYKLLI